MAKTAIGEGELTKLISPFGDIKGGLLECLHAVQAAYNHVPANSFQIMADVFNISRAEVYGVFSYYHDFRKEPAGNHIIKVCQAEACQAMGSRSLTTHLLEKLGIEMGQTTLNGEITVEAIYCLGNCALSPNLTINGKLHARVDANKFDRLLANEVG